MLAIKNNIMAGNAARHLGKAYDSLASSVERLASGLRINSAKDDAAGLAVRELIRADIAVLQQGSRNASDGISMLQTMEGALGVMDDNLIRMKELAEQAATGSYSTAQRVIMNAEFSEMADEIDRISTATKFNDINMLNSNVGSVEIHVGTAATIDIDKVDMSKSGLGINTGVNVATRTFTDTVTNTSSGTFVTIGGGTQTLTIQFDDGATTSEDAVVVSLTAQDYTMDELVAEINAISGAMGFEDDGTSKSYVMASTVDDGSGNYSLKLTSRLVAAASEIEISDGTWTDATGALDASADSVDVDAVRTSLDTVTGGVNILTVTDATASLTTLTSAINTKDSARARFGYKMNRLESTIAILDIQSENLMAAESRISDVDVATEMATLTRTQVLAQAGISMLSQANQMPQMALSLLR